MTEGKINRVTVSRSLDSCLTLDFRATSVFERLNVTNCSVIRRGKEFYNFKNAILRFVHQKVSF